MEIGRPETKSQPSRKGKRAWRKNIDLDDLHEGLEESRELERTVGVKAPENIEPSKLFQVDTVGDENIKKRKGVKTLKADEILNRRSAIPALNAPHKKVDKVKKKSVQGVSKKEIHRLMKVAGRAGESSGLASIEKDGLTKIDPYDIWGAPENPKKKASKPIEKMKDNGSFINDLKATTSHTNSTVRPFTLSEQPVALVSEKRARSVNIPEEGRSYNPSLDAWKELIEEELAKEQERENLRIKLIEKQNRIEHIMETVDDGDMIMKNDSDSEKADIDTTIKSVNKPVVVKTKTRQQRNKEKRHKERLKLEAELRGLKQQIKDLENIPRLLREEQEKLNLAEMEANKNSGSEGKNRKKKFGKYHIEDAPLEVKLSDELTDSLRRLKPEGNLTKDRFRSLQERGLIEVRMKVSKRRRYAKKATEKWSYKDIKI